MGLTLASHINITEYNGVNHHQKKQQQQQQKQISKLNPTDKFHFHLYVLESAVRTNVRLIIYIPSGLAAADHEI